VRGVNSKLPSPHHLLRSLRDSGFPPARQAPVVRKVEQAVVDLACVFEALRTDVKAKIRSCSCRRNSDGCVRPTRRLVVKVGYADSGGNVHCLRFLSEL
jgi:hypothetical protein